jgi:hypothetical protein
MTRSTRSDGSRMQLRRITISVKFELVALTACEFDF